MIHRIILIILIVFNAVTISVVSPHWHEMLTFALLQEKLNPTSPCCPSCIAGVNG